MAKKVKEETQNADPVAVVEETTKDLLSQLGVTATVAVTQEEESVMVSLDSEDSGILIGYHGETLQSLQLIISLLVAKKLGNFMRVIVNIGDYREKREEKLRAIAIDAANRAKETGQEVAMRDLLPWQRRIIHVTLQEDPAIETVSQGEEPNRELIIRVKQ